MPSMTCSAVNSVRDALGKEILEISDRIVHTKPPTDFAETLKDIDDKIQRYDFSNSNSSSVMIIKDTAKFNAEIKGFERSTEVLDHAIKAMESDKDMLVEGKATELIPAKMLEYNFEMGWAEKNHMKKVGPLKARAG